MEMNYNLISRHRAPLMGLAMLMIVLFHVGLPRMSSFYGLHRLGNVGVDIFLFLSGIGLWFSWTKRPGLRHFYRRRLLRVYPAWLIVAAIFFIPLFHDKPLTLVGELLINVNFWIRGELVFWFIPAILAMYLVAPFYMTLIRRCPLWRWLPVLLVVWCVAVQWVQPLHESLGHLEIFFSRLPIFFIGINCGEAVREQRALPRGSEWPLLLCLACCFLLCLYLEQVRHGLFPLFVERMVYIPFTLSLCLLCPLLLERLPRWLTGIMAWVGSISLETYLIHYEFILMPLTRQHLGYWPTALLTIALSLPLAWLLHRVVGIKKLKN